MEEEPGGGHLGRPTEDAQPASPSAVDAPSPSTYQLLELQKSRDLSGNTLEPLCEASTAEAELLEVGGASTSIIVLLALNLQRRNWRPTI